MEETAKAVRTRLPSSAFNELTRGFHRPEESVYNAAMSTVTSSAFLSLSLGTAWGSICAFQHYLPNKLLPTKRFYIQVRSQPRAVFLSVHADMYIGFKGFLAGLWVALVPAQRAVDLGLYSLRIAIQCAWDVGVARGKVKNIRWVHIERLLGI